MKDPQEQKWAFLSPKEVLTKALKGNTTLLPLEALEKWTRRTALLAEQEWTTKHHTTNKMGSDSKQGLSPLQMPSPQKIDLNETAPIVEEPFDSLLQQTTAQYETVLTRMNEEI